TVKYISTAEDRVVLHADRMQTPGSQQRGGGKSQPFAARTLPRTVLSSAQTADETRTAVLLRHEMRRWIQLQLEPSALRRPDEFHAPQQLAADGAHIAATLHRLSSQDVDENTTNAAIANRLAELVEGVRAVRVDRDTGRRLLQFMMTDRRGIELPAASLSDGTLRFVALAILEADPTATGVVCLEEPENGIHPLRIPAMLRLLGDMAVDARHAVDPSNPLRQVIVSTHSPLVVASSPDADLVFATARTHSLERLVDGLEFRGTHGSWRHGASGSWVSPGEIGRYLGATVGTAEVSARGEVTVARALEQLLLPLSGSSAAHDSE
ncbi:MAG: ATP-binding protein, partial [Myxococcales bacterium]|nr:ATP-binding protein [Myxococcales bacterium]